MKALSRLVALLCLGSAAMWAQGTAQINGSVKDSTGLAVPGAEVKVTQTGTGAARTTTSSADGTYTLPNLPIGPYMLEVAKEGFTKYVQTGIVLNVDGSPTIDATLKIGSVNEQVTVQADANMVETHSTSVGTVVDSQRVVEMPLNGRNATELIFLSGMANTGGANGGFLNSVRNYPTVMVSVTGGVGNWITFNWDGANHNDAYNSLNLPLIFPDAIQEFKVESSALPAQYGMHASANVNVVTKSGTNEFHGNAFEFLRNGDLNARDFFSPTRDTLKRNQYGGTAGGRIIKDKLFIFGGYQATVQRSEPTGASAYVPTAAVLQGDFSTFASAACNNGRQFTLPAAAGFNGNKISPSLLNPAALKIAAIMTTPTDPCGKVFYGLRNNQDEKQWVTKLDWQKSDKHSMYLRTFMTDLKIPTTYDGKNALTHQSNAQADRVYSMAFGDTYLFGSAIVNSFHAGVNRSEIVKVLDDFIHWKDVGVNVPFEPAPEPHITISGGNGFAFGSGNSIINHDMGGPNPSVNDDVSYVRGSHQLGFGGSYVRTMLNYASGVNSAGSMTFNGSSSLGLGMAEFMLGQATTFAQGNIQSYLYNRQNYLSLYAQDGWKVRPNLTINYGVRWEPFFAFRNKHGYYDHFDPNLFAANVHSTRFPNAPAGLFFPGDAQFTPTGNKIANNRFGEFAPRLGIVWDPEGKGKMTIRASAGVFMDRGALYSMSAMAQDTPYGTVIQQTNVNMSNPWATYPGGNPLPLALNTSFKFPTAAAFVTYNPNWKPTWVNQFNLSVQRQFGSDWLLTANYVGNTTSHLITAGQINPAQFLGLGPCTLKNGVSYPVCSTTANQNFRRVLYQKNPTEGQYYGVMAVTDDGGTGSYNGLYIQAQKRMSKGVSLLANYTWSHCISDLWNGNPGNTGQSSVSPFNRKNDRSNCNLSDQRHVVNLSLVAQTPKFSNKALRLLASDWQFAPIMKLKSSQFYMVATGTDTALDGEGGGNQRAQIVPGVDPYLTDRNACSPAPCVAWANPKAYTNPAPGTLGNVSIFSLKGPGVFQLDLALSRTFTVREKKTLQLRMESFNLPNHLNPSTPGALSTGAASSALTNSATSYAITSDISGTSGLSAGDYRVIQFALKFTF